MRGFERLLGIGSTGPRASWSREAPAKQDRTGEGTEHAEQVALIRWCRLNEEKHPALKLIYAVPNGEMRHPAVANRLQAEGVKKGVPDLFLPAMRSIYGGLYIEMKRESSRPKRGGSGGMSPDQQDWRLALLEAGYRHAVCYGFEEARQEIEDYLELEESVRFQFSPTTNVDEMSGGKK
ncbi:MAG: VRR-NUC domain-containing protein [Thermoplasmataceae archaeon]